MATNHQELFGAIERGDRKRIAMLISSDHDVEAVNDVGDTPLLHAIRMQRHVVIALLLEAGADPNHAVPLPVMERRERGKHIKMETPLSLATLVSDVASIDLLLKRGARIQDSNCEAAACLALFHGGKRAKTTVLRLLDAGLNPKSSWKGLRLYRIAEGHKEVLAKLNSLGETMQPMKQRQTRSSSRESNSDFISFIHHRGHPEWVVLAVEAPVERVSSLYAMVCSAQERLTDVPVRASRKKDDEIAPLIAIAQPKESTWSVILRTLCLPIDMPDITDAGNLCQTMSAKLKTRTLAFFGEDTSFAMGYILYQNGKKVGSKDWESQRDSTDLEFDALGIYLPACYPRRDGEATWVCAQESSIDRIQRADVVDLGKA